MSVDSDRWRRAEVLFHAALEYASPDRGAFLDQSCGDDSDLRLLVDQLISKDSARPSFLERPAALAAESGGSPGEPSSPSPGVEGGTLPREDLVGRQIGSYRITLLLGAGGMGEVYRAHDDRLDRDVAIKILPTEFARDPSRLARFHREARVLASLNHPNIAAIYGLEEAAGRECLVLELVEGQRLRGPLPRQSAIDLALQVADALDAAHQHGIVHRDLKPANVNVTPEGRVKVLDFGLAKAIATTEPAPAPGRPTSGREPETTMTGNLLGTPGYMSPEQARGEAVDQRTDVWAFGCLLFELLTGRRAFEIATVADTVTAILEREPDWRALSDDTPPAVRSLLKRCLTKELEARERSFADVRAVLAELPRVRPRQGRATGHAASVDAYELCLRARYQHQQRTPDGLARALRLFEQAIERDPECALAHAGVAHVCLIACYFGGMPTVAGMQRMKAAALRAVELDETLAVGHVRLGDALCFKDWDWPGAEREFLRALELDPESPEARCRFGLFLWARQRFEESLDQLTMAIELDPLSLDANWVLGWAFLSLERLADAEATAGRLLAMAPSAWLGHHLEAFVHLRRGALLEATIALERAAALEGGPAMLCTYAACCVRAGKFEDAHAAVATVEQMATRRIVPPTWMAMGYDAVGAVSETTACMEQAVRERHMLLVHMRGWMDLTGMLAPYRHVLDEHDL